MFGKKARIRRFATGALAVTFLFSMAACGDDDSGTPPPSRSPGSGAVPSEPPEGEVNRPQEGDYVYRLTGTGENRPAAGTKLTQNVSVDGDVVTSVITTNQNANRREIVQHWLTDRILHVSSVTTIQGNDSECTPEPPIETLRIPVERENYPPQDWRGDGCAGTSEYRVTGSRRVEDAGGRVWQAWRIEEKINSPRLDFLVHFFSPALGVDIRVEDQERLTLTVLESNPS